MSMYDSQERLHLNHACQCVTCHPERFPGPTRSDVRVSVHHFSRRFTDTRTDGGHYDVFLDGRPFRYTIEGMTGADGWALWIGIDLAEVHLCSCGSGNVCATTVHGRISNRADRDLVSL